MNDLSTPTERPRPGSESSPAVESGEREATWLFVLPWELRHPGGVSQVVANLFDATTRRRGHRPLMLVNSWDQRQPRYSVVDGRRTIHVSIQDPLGGSPAWRHVGSFLFRLPATLLRMSRLLKAERVTHVSVHYPGAETLTWILLRSLSGGRFKLHVSFHGSDVRTARESPPARRLCAWLLRRTDDVTACSEPLRQEVIDTFGLPPASVRVIDNGVDPALIERLAQAPPQSVLPSRYVLSLATIEHKKGLDILVDAFAQIAARHPDLSLVLAGRVAEPDFLQRLVDQIAAHPAADRIVILKDLEHAEAMRVLSRAQLLALSSRKEPFGIVVLEAGVVGVPVVATQACGVARLLVDGEDLVVVRDNDVQSMADGLCRALSDPDRSRWMAERLRAKVLREFTWDRIVVHYDGPPRH